MEVSIPAQSLYSHSEDEEEYKVNAWGREYWKISATGRTFLVSGVDVSPSAGKILGIEIPLQSFLKFIMY